LSVLNSAGIKTELFFLLSWFVERVLVFLFGNLSEFSAKIATGGVTRAKRHQIKGKGDVGACLRISLD